MTETANATVTIEQTVRIAAPPEAVWRFWTEPERLGEWWGHDAQVVAEPGGLFRIVMESGHVMRGTFSEFDPPHRLVFSFGWEHNAPGQPLAPGSTRVEVTLRADGGETVLVLRHSDMPVIQAPDHVKGWTYFIGERLAAAAAA